MSTLFKLALLSTLLHTLVGCNSSSNNYPALPRVENIKFLSDQLNLKLDSTKSRIQYSVIPRYADTSELHLTSTDNSIITVEDNGDLTPVGTGQTNILAINNGQNIAEVAVTVRKVKMYSIGNSHTLDFGSKHDFLLLSSSQDIQIENDWHVNCGQSIERILSDPTTTCSNATYENYQIALNEVAYDVVTIQPFSGITGASEAEAVIEMINYVRETKSKNAKIYIYSTWPLNSEAILASFKYTDSWEAPFYEYDPFASPNKNFIEYLKSELRKNNVIVDGYIPVGDVLSEIHKAAVAGNLVHYQGAGELYRDAFHLNNMGRFVAGSTVLHTLFENVEIDNHDLPAYEPSENWDSDRMMNGLMRKELIEIVDRVCQ